MNEKSNPNKCDAQLCCKATAKLQLQVKKEKEAEDPKNPERIEELLKNAEKKDAD
jgi:hypothetical protein